MFNDGMTVCTNHRQSKDGRQSMIPRRRVFSAGDSDEEIVVETDDIQIIL